LIPLRHCRLSFSNRLHRWHRRALLNILECGLRKGSKQADGLVLAELANETKHGSQAQMDLRTLQKSASSKGFGLIARKASQESSVPRKSIGAM
jgi:hypothetical protein